MAREIAVLSVKVTADTAEVKAAFARIDDEAQKATSGFHTLGSKAVAVGNMIADAFSYALGKLRDFGTYLAGLVGQAIKLSAQYNAAQIALIGSSRAFGISSDEATAAARRLAADGLLPLGDAAKGLTNLLRTGFNLEQSVNLMNAFKDAAVYGRQANYKYADSIVTATEGIRNMLSRQVDNVGITKNISVLMKEQGYQMEDLTDKVKGAGARLAFYNGLMRETVAFQGDAARSLGTYSGAIAVVESSYKGLLARLGDFVTLNKSVGLVLTAVGDLLRWVTDRLYESNTGYKVVSDAIELGIRTFSAFLKALDFVQRELQILDMHLRSMLKDFADFVAGIAGLLTSIAQLAAKIPGGTAALGLMGDELASLYLIQTEATRISKEQAKVIEEDQGRMKQWSGFINTATTALDKLADQVHASRGEVLQLSELARPAGQAIVDAFSGTADAAKEAKNAWKQSAKEIQQVENQILTAWRKFDKELEKEEIQAATAEIKNLANGILLTWKVADEAMEEAEKGAKEVKDEIDAVEKKVAKLQKAWEDFQRGGQLAVLQQQVLFAAFQKVPDAIFHALKSGQSVVLAGVTALADSIGQVFARRLRESIEKGFELTPWDKMLGGLSIALDAALGGFGVGAATGSKTKGILGGAAGGAAAGAALGPLGAAIGGAVGGIAGLFGAIFGGKKKQQEQREQLRQAKQALIDQYGGFEKLRKAADAVGVSIERAYRATTVKEFESAVRQLNTALEDQKARLAALGQAVEGVNKRAELLATPFRALQEVIKKAAAEGATAAEQIAGEAAQKKLLELAQRSQGAFETLGLAVRDTFAGLVREEGNALAAIQKLAPAFTVLRDGVKDFGLTSTAVIDELIADFDLVTNEAFKPLFDAIVASGDVLKALFEAKALSPETFQALAADIGASIQQIVDKGGDMARTLALSAPVLQTLWEAQQRYGGIVDETTAALLKEAEQQGLVGAKMKSVNQQILDVLIAIGQVLKADLPKYLTDLVKPAQEAAGGIEDAFNRIEVNPIKIPVEVAGAEVPQLARGGVVRRPTLALVGEAGPEAIVPLTGEALGVTATYVTDIYLDGERIARSTAKKMPSVLRGVGVG